MADPWNLTPTEWANVLADHSTPEDTARRLLNGSYLPWNEVLLRYTQDSHDVLDLGSGRGELSALLAVRGKRTTLLDWSQENLDFSRRLFEALGKQGTFVQEDMTRPLPFNDGSFDTVFSCGVFEYFTDEQIRNILREAFRVSRKRVMVLVPNALSLPYRVGMWHMKRTNAWPWGGERPFATLAPHFQESAKSVRVSEFTVGTKHALRFLTMRGGKLLQRLIVKIGRAHV